MKQNILWLVLSGGLSAMTAAQDRPNILWLTTEDMSANHLSCYGNIDIQTPNIDAFAAQGIRFTNAYSNGPQCSPARTTLITGMYSPALMAEWHRKERIYPYRFFYPLILQQNGYYCTNSGKTDYNSEYDKGSLAMDIWNSNSVTSLSKLNVPANKPFFAAINFYETHMSRITEYDSGGTLYKDRKFTKANPKTVHFTNYLPHTDTIKNDMAYHLEKTLELDAWFGSQLSLLKSKGLEDNTIVFFYSDHGGCLPGSKGYIRDEGVRVPLIIYFPDKWKHLAPMVQPATSDQLVCFADFAPTIYSLLGIQKPAFCQGKAFAGPTKEAAHDYIYLYKANQELNFIPARGVTDAKYKFIWNYNTAFCSGGRNDFQWGMPGLRDWEMKYRNGELKNNPQWHNYFWQPMVAYELYDLAKDPDEMNNVAYESNYSEILAKYKGLLQRAIRENKDLGFFPESMRDTMNTYEKLNARNYNIEQLVSAAELSGTATANDADALKTLLKNPDAAVRYWAAMGFFQLSRNNKISVLPELVEEVASNQSENGEVRAACAAALVYKGNSCKGLNVLLEYAETNFGRAILQNIEDKAKPLMRTFWNNYLLGKNGYYPRSILINGGVIPYSAMFGTVGEPDTSMFATEWQLWGCKTEGCPALINDNFNSGSTLPNGWKEQNTTGQVYLNNQRLELFFDPANTAKPLAKRTFTPVSGIYQFKFVVNVSRNTLNVPITIRNSSNQAIAMVALNSGIKLVTSIDGAENPVTSVNMIPESNVPKATDHTMVLTIDTKTNKQTLTVNNITLAEATNVTLLKSTDNIASIEIYNKYMWNGKPTDLGYVYFDNLEVTANPADKSQLLIALKNARTVLDSTLNSVPCRYPTTQWITLSDSVNSKEKALNRCNLTTEAANELAGELSSQVAYYILNHKTTLPEKLNIYSTDYRTSIEPGKTLFLATKTEPADVCNQSVRWESSDTTIATIDQNGLMVAKKAGMVTIKAQANADPTIGNTLQITVGNALYTMPVIDGTAKINYQSPFNQLVINCTTHSDFSYKIVSATGTTRITGKANGSAYISTSGLNHGLYLVIVKNGSSTIVSKFIK